MEAAGSVMQSGRARRVAILYDWTNGGPMLQMMQDRLSIVGISSIPFNADPFLPGDLSEKLRRLMKKRMFNAIVMATPHNAVAIVAAAANASVMQQNYFWLVIDSGGLSKSHLLPLCPSNCNLALLRGGTTGVNEPSGCPPAVRDVFPSCDTDSIRTLDIRLVDAIEALAKALTDSLTQPGFQTSNASCFPLQPWSSGAHVLSNVLSMSNFDSDRGVISYNSTTGFFNAQGVEVVASLTERVGPSVRFVLSGRFSSGSLTKLFHKSGAGFVFPNTFKGFNNATIVACAPVLLPITSVVADLGNDTFIGGGFVPELIDYLSKNLHFQYIFKRPSDGQWGSPVAGSSIFSGCVGELQRGCQTGMSSSEAPAGDLDGATGCFIVTAGPLLRVRIGPCWLENCS